jgi:hypothetical protein
VYKAVDIDEYIESLPHLSDDEKAKIAQMAVASGHY